MVRTCGTTGKSCCSILCEEVVVVMEHRGRAAVRKTQTGASWQLELYIGLDELLETDSDTRFRSGVMR